MPLSPFHAYYLARTLRGYANGRDRLLAALASADIEIFPHQIAAALFALRSPYLKGAILCDDGSLGKTYEALLAISQKWYEGKDKILIIVPTPLLRQWIDLIDRRFAVALFALPDEGVFQEALDNGLNNPFRQPGFVITTYDFAVAREEYIAQIEWDVVVFEEAHHLRRAYAGDGRKAAALRQLAGGAFKLLLTATPIQNSILDLYGLIRFIDDRVFLDEDSFYRRYFRKPENYGELAQRVSPYCFRTFRRQVETYVKIPRRLPVTHEYTLTGPEQKLKSLLDAYLKKDHKAAFPKMERYDLTLLLLKCFSSSYAAFEKTLKGIIGRLEKMRGESPEAALELQEFQAMLKLTAGIKGGAKSEALLAALKTGFAELKKLGARAKALIFTENVSTQKYLYALLNQGSYKGKVLVYNGSNSRDYEVIEKFRDEAQILIATDIAAEGFNLEFCSLVVNYDLPYNALTIEQRISRCHRQGQECDVLVVNFLNRDNFADVRVLELINKRLTQFDGVFGLADDWLGDFGGDLSKALATARSKEEIDRAFDEALETHKAENKELVALAEESLFTSFTPAVSRAVSISPQYAKDQIRAINDAIWRLTKYFFRDKDGYTLDDATRTLLVGVNPQKVFTGTRLGRREYSMIDRSLPKSAWYTLSSSLAQNILSEIFWQGIPDEGEIQVETDLESCLVGFYEIRVTSANDYFSDWRYYVFVGRSKSGQVLADAECARIMDLPVTKFSAQRERYGQKDGISKPKSPAALDRLIDPEPFIRDTLAATDMAERHEIERLKAYALEAKVDLERKFDQFKREINQAGDLPPAASVAEKLRATKVMRTRQAELKRIEERLFLDKRRLELDLEKRIEEVKTKARLTATVNRIFAIEVKGNGPL